MQSEQDGLREKLEKVKKQKKTSLFIRPSNSGDMPFYAPERDFAIEGLRMINEARMALVNCQEGDAIHEKWQSMGGCHDLTTAKKYWNAAGEALEKFVLDARCESLDSDTMEIRTLSEDASPTWEDAIEDLHSVHPPLALDFVLRFVGFFALDAFFFGTRESARLGQPLHYSYRELVDAIHQIHLARIAGGPQPIIPAKGMLSTAVRALRLDGFSPEAVEQIVRTMIAEDFVKGE